MWQHIRLSSLGVIDEAELELGPGFSVITGETGAGKTMVVTALGLLRGERADLGLVRHGASQARVEAVVDVPPTSGVAAAVEESGGVLEDDGSVVLARVLSAQGRSRAYVGGSTAPASVLSDVTDELVAVHGQSDQHRLLRAAEQRRALDGFAGPELATVLERLAPVHARLREVERTLDDLRTHSAERLRELNALRAGLDEIAAAEPRSGEDDDLLAEENRLAHAEALARAAATAHDAVVGDDSGNDGARAVLAGAMSALAEVSAHDPTLDAMADRLRESAILLDELAMDLSAYATDVDLDPARLAAVQERRADLTQLVRAYGPTLDDVIAWHDASAARVMELDLGDDAEATLEAEREALTHEGLALARRASAVRSTAAEALGVAVTAELGALSMPHARIEIAVTQRPEESLTASGLDDVEMLFAANNGSPPRPLARGASGGELSRLMLALEVVLVDESHVPTLVFDEVDAGIGGRAAVEVGRRLARLAQHAQVLAVTHLPQVAAFADHHFRVEKNDDGLVTSSAVVELQGDDRVDELARMLAGLEDSSSAQAHARELLDLARDA